MKRLTNLENKHLRSVDHVSVMDLVPLTRNPETNFWPLSWRDLAARYLRTHRRRSTFPGSEHLQTRESLCLRYGVPFSYGKVGRVVILLTYTYTHPWPVIQQTNS